MGTKLLPWRRIVLFAMLSIADLALTRVLFHRAGGAVYEGNPVAAAWLENHGWAGLALFKGLCVALVLTTALVIWLRRPQIGADVLTFACAVTAATDLYSANLLVRIGQSLAGTW